jgi:DEAD/DEAH box helicase domain-containing protein
MGERRSQKVKTLVDQDSFTWLAHLLETQDETLYQRVALAQGLLFTRKQTGPEAWLAAAQARLPEPLVDLLQDQMEEEALLGLREGPTGRDPVTLWASISPGAAQAISADVDRARRGLTVALHLNDRQEEQTGDFESDWNGFLRLYNLSQFVPDTADEEAFRGYGELIGLAESDSLHDHIPDGDTVGEGEPIGKGEAIGEDEAIGEFNEEKWEKTFADAEYSPDAVTTLLEGLHEAELPAPDVLHELRVGGEIVGTAEIGWPGFEVAVLLPDQESYRGAFEDDGWTVHSISDVDGAPERLTDALLEAA